MPTRDGKLGVGVCGVGWCASQHIAAFQRNPRAAVTWLCGRDRDRTRANLAKHGLALPEARVTTSFDELLASPDVDIVSIATPNHLHADQAVAAARAGKHFVLEKPTGLDEAELVRIRDAVRKAGVRTIVSFVLRFNPFLKFARWLRTGGWLGDIRFAPTQYLSNVTHRWTSRRSRPPIRSTTSRWSRRQIPRAVRRFASCARCPNRPTSPITRSNPRSTSWSRRSSTVVKRRRASSTRRRRWRCVSRRIDRRSAA